MVPLAGRWGRCSGRHGRRGRGCACDLLSLALGRTVRWLSERRSRRCGRVVLLLWRRRLLVRRLLRVVAVARLAKLLRPSLRRRRRAEVLCGRRRAETLRGRGGAESGGLALVCGWTLGTERERRDGAPGREGGLRLGRRLVVALRLLLRRRRVMGRALLLPRLLSASTRTPRWLEWLGAGGAPARADPDVWLSRILVGLRRWRAVEAGRWGAAVDRVRVRIGVRGRSLRPVRCRRPLARWRARVGSFTGEGLAVQVDHIGD